MFNKSNGIINVNDEIITVSEFGTPYESVQ